MKNLFIILAGALLLGCASTPQKTKANYEAEWAKNYTPTTVRIHSAPSGAVIDRNGDIVGTTPCDMVMPQCWRGGWPADGQVIQKIRARWLDGTTLYEFYPISSTPPKTMLFLHPNAVNYMRQAPPTLSQN